MNEETRICPECGTEFTTKNSLQIYCRTYVVMRAGYRDSRCRLRARGRRYDRKRSGSPDRIQRSRDWRQKMREEGRCTRCGGTPPPNLKVCHTCRENVWIHCK